MSTLSNSYNFLINMDMECNHNNVVAIINPTAIEVTSNHGGNFIVGAKTITYKCSTCGQTQKNPFGNLIPKKKEKDDADSGLTRNYIGESKHGYVYYDAGYDSNFTNRSLVISSGSENIAIGNIAIGNKSNNNGDLLQKLKHTINEIEEKKKENLKGKELIENLRKKKTLSNAFSELGAANKLGMASVGQMFSGALVPPKTLKSTTSKPPVESKPVDPIKKAIEYISILLAYRVGWERVDVDGVNYYIFTFHRSLDIDDKYLDFFGLDVEIVEWEEIPNKKFGIESKIFGVTKNVKALKIKEDVLISQYENRMEKKIS